MIPDDFNAISLRFQASAVAGNILRRNALEDYLAMGGKVRQRTMTSCFKEWVGGSLLSVAHRLGAYD